MRRILISLLLAAVTYAGASRPNCAPYTDKSLYYFGQDGTVFNTGAISYGKFEMATDAAPYLRRFISALNSRGTEVVMLPIPVLGFTRAGQLDAAEIEGTPFAQVDKPDYLPKALAYHAATVASLQASGALTVDFMLAALEALQKNPDIKLFFKQDAHWRPEAAELAAQAIADRLKKDRPALAKQLATDNYKLVNKGDIAREIFGWNVRIKLDCPSVAWQPLTELYPNVEAELEGGDLLDDRPVPILLAGTSYSSQTYSLGFAEYLRHALGADVLNMSLNAGGAVTGLLNYYTDRKIGEPDPKLLIWELPSASVATKTDTSLTAINMRQLLPLVTINPKKIDEVDVTAAPEVAVSAPLGLAGHEKSFVRITFADYKARTLNLSLGYSSGDEKLQLVKERTTTFGSYSIELDGNSPLQNIKLSLPKDAQGQIKVEFFNY